jgi:hypothetical protein
MNREEEGCIQVIRRKARSKEATRKTKTYVGE